MQRSLLVSRWVSEQDELRRSARTIGPLLELHVSGIPPLRPPPDGLHRLLVDQVRRQVSASCRERDELGIRLATPFKDLHHVAIRVVNLRTDSAHTAETRNQSDKLKDLMRGNAHAEREDVASLVVDLVGVRQPLM